MGNGGAERVVSNILPSLSKEYNIYLILLRKGIFYKLPKNIKIITLVKINYNSFMIFFPIIYIWKLKKLIKQYQPDKIVSFLEIANFINILINKDALVSFRTSLYFFDKLGFAGKIYKTFVKFFYPRAKLIITNSKENETDLISQINVIPTKIKTIYNPINTKKINLLKNEKIKLPFQREKKQKIFVTVGRLDALKNISTIIKSFKDLSTKNILLIIGDGSEKINLQNLIKKYNLDKQIFLLGKQKNVYKYLGIANYFIFASKAEGFPNVLVEAMTCRLPIITSDFKTGAREIIDPKLDFKKKIKYPYYGPNGVLLNLNTFSDDFKKINLKRLKQKQVGKENFIIDNIIKKWDDLLKS